MNLKLLLVILAPAVMIGGSTSLQFVLPPDRYASAVLAKGVLSLPGASVAVYGAQTISPCVPGLNGNENCDQTQPPLLSILDASGKQIAALSPSALGNGNSVIVSAAADADGNIWITGETDSDDFPLVHAPFTQKTPYRMTGFVAKLDPGLDILFSCFLAGQAIPTEAHTNPVAIALDSAGNAYVAGTTNDPNFPVTGPPFGSPFASPAAYAFVVKMRADGSGLAFSRLLGGTGTCSGGAFSGCLPSTAVTALAVDGAGNVTLAGDTTATDFPVTANVYNTGGGAFVSRISADGSTLIWSTEVGALKPGIGSINPSTNIGAVPGTAQSLALDSAGNVFVTGTGAVPISTTPGALQSTWQSASGIVSGGFALELSSDGTKLLFATNLSGTNGSVLNGLALDAGGNVWISGFTTSPDFPGLTVPESGIDFALELSAGATGLQQIVPLIMQTVSQPPAFASDGNLLLLSSAGNLLRMNPITPYSAPAVFAITNSAIPQAAVTVLPGELMTIYGVGLGPSSAIVASPDSNGLYPLGLGGASVQFNSLAGSFSVPLLYAGPTQINFEVPLTSLVPTLPLTTMTIISPNGALSPVVVNVGGSIGVFGVLNADGSLNGPSNPAVKGSIVSLYVTGLGLPSNRIRDGVISPSANPAFQNFVEVDSNSSRVGLPVFYAGVAPGEIDGLDQINVQLPAEAQNPTLTVSVPSVAGSALSATSNGVVVFTR